MNAGYSGTPLAKKLGLKDGQAVAFVGLPASVSHLLSDRAYREVESVDNWVELSDKLYDVVHLFSKEADVIRKAVHELADRIVQTGMIWVSWPKKASKVQTDVTEDVVREAALRGKLVDVKVGAVDSVWSGLKLVIRKDLRQ
ncbi:MAG: DUF3052 family protein [Pseudomonadota bacterium]